MIELESNSSSSSEYNDIDNENEKYNQNDCFLIQILPFFQHLKDKFEKKRENKSENKNWQHDDENDAPLDLYHPDIVVTVKIQTTITHHGSRRSNKKLTIKNNRFKVLNLLVGVAKKKI